MDGPPRRVVAFLIGPLLLVAGALLVAPHSVAAAAGQETTDEGDVVNVQQRITTVEDGVEIELRSTRRFPMRALSPVLRIGEREFYSSRYPGDGRLDILIFWIPADEFEALTGDEEVLVYYGRPHPPERERGKPAAAAAEPPGTVWSFGLLRKELLDRPPDSPPEE